MLNNVRDNMRFQDLPEISDSSDNGLTGYYDRRRRLQEILNKPQTDSEAYQSVTETPMYAVIDGDQQRTDYKR